jgi:hypothetical protein
MKTIKIIKTYAKFLFDKPFKLILLIGIIAFTQVFGWYVIAGNLNVEEQFETIVRIALCLLVTAIFVAINAQSFIEWKDGLEKKEKEDLKL